MATMPAEPQWDLKLLGPSDEKFVLEFLRLDPLQNAYFISRVIDEGLGPRGQTAAILRGAEVEVLASLSGNLALAGAPDLDRSRREEAMALLADHIMSRAIPVRALISDARLVDPLWRRLANHLSPPTVIRFNQPVYAIEASPTSLPDLSATRFATETDLDALVPACAAMHREEVGIDPLGRDATGYRQRIRELILKKRSVVLMEFGEIAFKCEFSAVTPAAVQLMGVWTRPDRRRRGLARVGLREVCGHLLRQGKSVSLFVNDFNRPAIALYESLGFRQIGTNRALIW